MNNFLAGGITFASLLAGLFFLRFWRTTGDRFFLYFACSFVIEAINRTVMGLVGEWREDFPFYYLVRLVSYGLILLAIWEKNRAPSRDRPKSNDA